MISDVLFEAVEGLNHYLDEPAFDTSYEGGIRDEIIALKTLMNCMRARLDAPPTQSEILEHARRHSNATRSPCANHVVTRCDPRSGGDFVLKHLRAGCMVGISTADGLAKLVSAEGSYITDVAKDVLRSIRPMLAQVPDESVRHVWFVRECPYEGGTLFGLKKKFK